MKKKEDLSNIDKAQWEEYLKNPKDIFDKEKIVNKPYEINYRIRFDLHGFTLHDANKKVRELINNCQEKGFREILLITGNDWGTKTSKPKTRSPNNADKSITSELKICELCSISVFISSP